MSATQLMQPAQVGTDEAACADLKVSRMRACSDASTTVPQDCGVWGRTASSDSAVSDHSDWTAASDELTPGMKLATKGTISTLLAFLALPALLAWLVLPDAIALVLVSFYVFAVLSAAILPGMLCRGGTITVLLPAVYVLGAVIFLAKQVPPL